MKTAVAIAAFLSCALFQNNTCIGQDMMVPVTLEQRVAKSAAIVQGKVIEKHSYLSQSGDVYTLNTVKVNAWLKSHSNKDVVEVITFGGTFEDHATVVFPSLQLDQQSEYIFFLEPNNLQNDDKAARSRNSSVMQAMAYADAQGALKNERNNYRDLFSKSPVSEASLFSRISQLSHGKILTPGGKEFTARKVVSNTNAKVLAVTSFSPSTVNGGTLLPGDMITISGAGFGATQGAVWFSNANDGGATVTSNGVASDITSWSDGSITVKVPSSAGTGPVMVQGSTNMYSASPLTIGYGHIELNSNNVGFAQVTRQRYYLRNLNGSGGYTFLFNTTFNTNTAAVNAFTRAMATWRNATGLNFITGSTTAISSALPDGVNVVVFNAALPVGVLGRATSRFSGASNGSCNLANTVWWASDIDVEFMPDPPYAGLTWQYGPALATGSQVDFESVSVHELGHAAGLGHRIAPGEVMHYALSNGMNVRTPSGTEIAAVLAKLNYSALPATTCFNPAGSNVPMSLAISTLPVNFISFTGERKTSTSDLLHWVVSQVDGNTGYTIERSADGKRFSEAGYVQERNTNETEKTYAFTDDNAGIYPWYYRLKQVDINGSYTYSKSIFIKGDKNNAWRIFASTDGGTIHIYTNKNNVAVFQLLSSSGQQIINKVISNQVSDLPVNNLTKGVYYYKIIDNNNAVSSSGSLLLGN